MSQEEFIDNSKLNGQDGYALATVQVAVEYLITSDILADAATAAATQ